MRHQVFTTGPPGKSLLCDFLKTKMDRFSQLTRLHVIKDMVSEEWRFSFAHYIACFFIFSAVAQLLSCVWLFSTPWTAAHQAFLSLTISRSLLKLTSIELVMPSNHLILRRPLLLLPSIFPRIRVLSNDLSLCIRWPRYWSFSNELICIFIQLLFQDTFWKNKYSPSEFFNIYFRIPL